MSVLKLRSKILLLIILIPVFCFSQEKKVGIRIIQDQSTRLDEFETNIVLQKKAFKFQILLDQVEGVYVFASVKDSIYRFTETSPIRDFAYLKLLELRESDKFNINRDLNISETGWSYWFYNDTTEWHSFNKKAVSFGSKRIVCTKAIKELYNVATGETIKLKNLTAPLYLFFIAVKDYDANGKPSAELMRKKVRIDWVEED